jgi:hypothetical protein
VTVECHSVFNDPGATASDSCAGDLTGSIVKTGAVDVNTPGTYTLHYNVKDPSNNAAVEVTRTVNVVDTTAPNMNCKNVTVSLGSNGSVTVNANDINNGSSDNCGSVQLLIDGNPDETFSCLGTYPVTLTGKDGAGNAATCNATVTVQGQLTSLTYGGDT